MIKYYTYIICFFLGLSNLFGQSDVLHFNTSDGLQHDVTYNVFQDSKGYVWIGTDDGLSKFDGKTFKNYTLENGLTSSYVTDIKELTSGKLAIATWGGGLHFLKNDSIYKNKEFEDVSVKMYRLQKHDDKIYTHSGFYILQYDLKNNTYIKKFFNKKDGFSNDFINKKSNCLLKLSIIGDKKYLHDQGAYESDFFGVKELDGDFKTKEIFPLLNDFKVGAILKTKNNRFVFGIGNQLFFNEKNIITKKFEVEDIAKEKTIIKIIEANKNEFFLLARDKRGYKTIHLFNTATQKSINLINKLSIKSTISDAMIDFEGNLWITTFGDGVYVYKYNSPNIETVLNGNNIVDILKYQDAVYAISPSKLFKFHMGELQETTMLSGFAKSLSVVDDELYVSLLNNLNNESGLNDFKFSHGTFYKKINNGYLRQCDTIFLDKTIIANTNEIKVRAVEEFENKIQFYTNKGRWNYLVNEQQFKKDTTFQLTLNTQRINDYFKINKTKYYATDKGIEIKSPNSTIIFNENNGLQNERVNSLTSINGKVYAATQKGFSVINDEKNILNFSKSFGIQSTAINKIISVDNRIWVAGNNGIAILNADNIKESIAPKLDISQINRTFTYNTLSFIHEGSIALQYKINTNDWQELPQTKGVLEFENYKSGKYNIKFRSRNGNSKWSYSKTFSFKIAPPWYKVWWIILLLVVGSSGVVALLFYYRLKLETKRNNLLQNEIDKRIVAESELSEVRDNIARDFHDHLGNKLASISLLSEVLSKKVASNESDIAKTIKEDADYLYKGTKDFIFSLQEKSNYINELSIHLTDFYEDYLFQFGIDFEVKSNIQSNIKLPHYWSKQIIYIFKEVVTNIAKHSKAKNVTMKITQVNKDLIISVTDNGVGFNMETIKKRGLDNMTSRASKINCQLSLEPAEKKGAKVTFKGILP